jgi:hypothetical protein
MIPNENAWSIVINGYWNRMIFTPKWIGEKIFSVDSIERLVSMVPTDPVIYQKEALRIAISERKLVITPLKLKVDCMKQAEDKAVKILELLNHTPVSAIGVNFGFIEESPSAPLLELFAYKDNTDIGTQGWDISQSKLTRTLKDSDNKILNLILSYDGKKVYLDGNFHQVANSANEASSAIKEHTSTMYDHFMNLLKEVYGLSWQENSNNG